MSRRLTNYDGQIRIMLLAVFPKGKNPMQFEELKNLKFDNLVELSTEPFHIIDGWAREIEEPLFDKLYVYVKKTKKEKYNDGFVDYHNQIQNYSNFLEGPVIKTNNGNVTGIYEFYWTINYNYDKKQIVSPYYYNEDKFIPKRIKEVIGFIDKNPDYFLQS